MSNKLISEIKHHLIWILIKWGYYKIYDFNLINKSLVIYYRIIFQIILKIKSYDKNILILFIKVMYCS